MLRNSPRANRTSVRLRTRNSFSQIDVLFAASLLANEKTSDTPTMKINDGKTVSAKVQPFQAECPRKEKTESGSPGQFTTIIKAIVSPRKASREASRFFFGIAPGPGAPLGVAGIFKGGVLTKLVKR
jgi:hypothetical protein